MHIYGDVDVDFYMSTTCTQDSQTYVECTNSAHTCVLHILSGPEFLIPAGVLINSGLAAATCGVNGFLVSFVDLRAQAVDSRSPKP